MVHHCSFCPTSHFLLYSQTFRFKSLLFILVVLEYNTMKIGNTTQMTIAQEHTYVFNIDTRDAYKTYSSFVFQAHTTKSSVTLMNISRDCTEERECVTFGSHIGMVQLLEFPVVHVLFNFSVDYLCAPQNCSNETQDMLVVVVGIPLYGEQHHYYIWGIVNMIEIDFVGYQNQQKDLYTLEIYTQRTTNSHILTQTHKRKNINDLLGFSFGFVPPI